MTGTAVVVFAVTLLAAVLISERAHRTVLSTAVLFLIAGFLVGGGMLDLLPLGADHPLVRQIAELALFSVLFTDGMRSGVRDLTRAWRLPGRALLFGLPLTLVGTALVAHWVAGVPWTESFLLGAVLSPTDPVFAAAIVGREEIPWRLRHLLNVESGLNDGLALPIVVVLLAATTGGEIDGGELAGELALGVGIGIVVPWAAIALERTSVFAATGTYQPLGVFAIGLLVLGLSLLTHANLFLAAFAAGITVATVAPEVRDAFRGFGELVTELLKLAALLVFGVLISPAFLAETPASGYLFAVLAIVAVRPLSIVLALAGGRLGWRELGAAAWFGPKGFASVVYGLLVLGSGIARADELFHLIAIVIALSILAHSSTDVLVARLFREPRSSPEPVSDAGGDDTVR
jgi:NhaP-type Na+/H+ or K+/H+ antiporter